VSRPVWLGIIEGVSDGLASFAKLASGYYTDKLERRKPIAVAGYIATGARHGSFRPGDERLACAARTSERLARPLAFARRCGKRCLAGAVDRSAYARAFGLERAMDTVGAIIGPLSAVVHPRGDGS
jgi:hypothetical protein